MVNTSASTVLTASPIEYETSVGITPNGQLKLEQFDLDDGEMTDLVLLSQKQCVALAEFLRKSGMVK